MPPLFAGEGVAGRAAPPALGATAEGTSESDFRGPGTTETVLAAVTLPTTAWTIVVPTDLVMPRLPP